MTIVPINGNTYDTSTWAGSRAYIEEFPAMVNDVVAVAQDAADSATAAANVVANAMSTTSTTSLSIATGSKTFTTVDNLDTVAAFVDQMWVKAVSISNTTKYMIGTVTSATGATLVLNITATNGSGTVADWSIFATGAPGTTVLDIAGLSVVTIDPAADHIPFRDVSGSVNGKATFNAAIATVVGVSVQAYDADTLKSDTTANLTAGYTTTSYNAGPKSSGTFTPSAANGNLQYAVNGGAHTLAPMSSDGTLIIQYTNNASAGAITTSGFTKVSGSFTTTSGDDFICYLTKVNGFSHLNIVRMQ